MWDRFVHVSFLLAEVVNVNSDCHILFSHPHLVVVVVVHRVSCIADSVQLTKMLLKRKDYLVVAMDPEKQASKQLEAVMRRSYHKYGIFLDYDCSQGQEYLQEVISQL